MTRVPFALLLLSAFALTAVAADPPKWETVTSKAGQFTVEMPVKPSIEKTRTRKGTGGNVKTSLVGCTTAGGLYLAYRMDLPTAVVREAEEGELDAARDDLAEEWGGKVLSEKKVRTELLTGRDFTVRGKPLEGSGVSTVRVRMYLDGKTIYAVVVVSAANRELPEDTGRFLGSLALGEDKARPTGKPLPDPKGKELADWGVAVDTDGDCKFTPDGKKSLRIDVPGQWHDLNPHVDKLNAPRVLWAVDGDFTLSVKVGGEFKPTGKPQNPKSVPSGGGGIIVWNDSDNFIRLERFAISRDNKVSPFILFVEREGGYEGADHNAGYPGGDCYLKMERRGSRITGLVSTDGSKWLALKPIDTLWGAKLKVGLAATNSNSDPLSVKFEEVKLTAKLAADEKKGK